ncbi:DUF3307 domain-containing protein [Anditalea andensis]|uniref:DUF3307 domain-containing protein n=1 Tax=Anditalea andensis TaxID=1048983 RepID=A0A074L045_9BACT|nr:DUF3307 domain-containing protein [Anditalea andensis]KEO73865.1 hypothetical protein EL17_10210 [Anditalea andensis]
MNLFVKLLVAHLLGDFIFQSKKWVEHKIEYTYKSKYLYIHSLLHGILSWLLVFQIAFWPYVLVIMVTHYFIDLTKLIFQKNDKQKAWFFIDQALHLMVIGIVTWTYLGFEKIHFPDLTTKTWSIWAALIFLTTPTSVVIKILMSSWTPKVGVQDNSLQNAGKFIGILERLLIFTFITTAHWEGIGFLIAAKSIFRFGDLQESKDRKMTEYILIGTLLSFAIATLTGLMISLSDD